MPRPRQPQNFPTPGRCYACGQMCFDLASTIESASGIDRPGNCNPDSERHPDLLEQVFSTCYADIGPKIAQARELASTLGLGKPGSYRGFHWEVAAHTSADLTPEKLRLVDKYVHSGNFQWIGREKDDRPKYLWDNVAFKTVEATPQLLREYCAVSWTWGRYQTGYADGKPQWRRTKGVKWRVPRLPLVESRFCGKVERLTHLKHLLSSIRTFRYFWVDVLCINQNGNEEAQKEKKIEIAKQAQIFRNAKASIAFLWSLDEQDRHDLTGSLGALGGLLASCICFRPGQPFLGASSANGGCTFPQHSAWDGLFTRLQDDKWFTSLWALQELVLAPATMWMTQDGGIATINARPVTTRLFASAVRLLQKMSEIRNQQWILEEKSYLRRHILNHESSYVELRKALDDLDHRRRLALQEERRQQRERTDQATVCLELSTEPRIPNVFKHRQADQALQDEVDKWIKWSFGQAGIDVCLGASRTAILIAGSNREVVDNQSKEYALLAALKIGYNKELLPNGLQDFLECDEHNFSHKLLNVILREEGPKMFNILHETFVPEFQTISTNLLDVSEWELLPATFSYLEIVIPDKPQNQCRESDDDGDWIKITEKLGPLQQRLARYHQRETKRNRYVAIPSQKDRTLTGMSPWRAAYTNYKDSSFEGSVEVLPEDITTWHMHPAGRVHVPASAKIQDISMISNGTKIKLRLNGGEAEYDIFSALDLQYVWQTQKWLFEMLGNPGEPKFLFLPLYTCHIVEQDSSTRSKKLLGKREETIGVVLVGRARMRKRQQYTMWHKLGTYKGTGPTTSLGWKGGIIVTSPHEGAQISHTQIRRECPDLQSVATLFKQASSDLAAMAAEEDSRALHLPGVQRLQPRESMGSNQAASSSFGRYFGWFFGGKS
ncbi:hypothetical protein H2200_002322 [Cladophialophora chaetospira]|uniref:Heterokaryon incompatibility domain-containing protein n=1 Tax=Cladophialophora chaetospira TaxID=386627 RepID=A0AA38XJL7_9EURO|nr:hypothetical protein H2200_002322 [Cladophialophora chaetospira]